MDSIFSDIAQMMNVLTKPLGDAAPRRRHLIADYKDAGGRDYHRELMSWHSPGAADEALVGSVRAELVRRGYKLTALAERSQRDVEGPVSGPGVSGGIRGGGGPDYAGGHRRLGMLKRGALAGLWAESSAACENLCF